MALTTLSIRHHLIGGLTDFLQSTNMFCTATLDGTVELINMLASYTEEGIHLYPKIYVFNDEYVLKTIGLSEKIELGHGPKNKDTFVMALKKSAPLAVDPWCIYIHRGDEIKYGVFRSGNSVISVSPWDLLITNGDSNQPVIYIQQAGEKLVDVRGWNNESLLISFGTKHNISSPVESINNFISALSESVRSESIEQFKTFMRKVISTVIQKKHGTLAVIYNTSSIAENSDLKDGQIFEKPIDIIEKIENFVNNANSESGLAYNYQLQGYASLIEGMMSSDGITIFSNDGKILAYNVFVKHPIDTQNTNIQGGARSRTYKVLCNLNGKELKGVFIQSQDGEIKFSI